MVGGVVRRREAVGMTPKQRHSNMVADRGEPPPRMAVCPTFGVAPESDWRRHEPASDVRRHTNWPSRNGRRTARRPWPQPPEACNRIKASLSGFQRREVKVLGFGVKTRPRAQRMALRVYCDPFGLVGANGKACGEAPGVFSPGTPPGVLVCAPLAVDALAGFMC